LDVSSTLSQEQIATYKRDGYVFPVPGLSYSEADALRLRLETFENETGEKAGNVIRSKGHLKLMAVFETVSHPAVLDAVEGVLGPDILCWGTSLFVKDPHDQAFVAWHQDSYYWGLEPDDVCSAWIALAPSTLENGAMKVIPGTHKDAEHGHKPSQADSANMLFTHEEIATDVDEGQAVSLLLDKGEMSLHHVKIVHGSAENRSDTRRYGLAIRYVAPHVRQTDSRDSALLVRGEDRFGHFRSDPVPTRDMDPDIVAAVEGPFGSKAWGELGETLN
jgi:non-heme Fe2+,alpha-ketoglutarate-dependent halogenase